MRKLIVLTIQDGENSYTEFAIVKDRKEAKELKESIESFTREIKDEIIHEITEEENEVLRKFGVI